MSAAAGLGALGFWLFLAAVVVAGIWFDARKRESDQETLRRIVESGQLSIFANAYWGHPAYRLPPEVNLLAVAHYLEALDWQADVVKIHTIFGGKNPHPNFAVGGVPISAIAAASRSTTATRSLRDRKVVTRASLIHGCAARRSGSWVKNRCTRRTWTALRMKAFSSHGSIAVPSARRRGPV